MKTFKNLKEGNETIEVVMPSSNAPLTPATLSAETITRLTNRLGDEYYAYYLYRAAADWCQNVGYVKAAAFFTNEMKSELEHADGIRAYLTGWNIFPQIPTTNTVFSFGSLIDVINQAYAFEYKLYQSYIEDSQSLFVSDLATFDFLKKYRDIQVDSVAEFSDLLNAAMLIDTTNKLDVLYFENQYFN